MPFHNPFWAKKQSTTTTGYLTLGMYPITVNITGSQTEIGSSANTIEASYASNTEDYWKTERTIPAYTYFTLGSNPVNENTVTPVADPEVANVPGGTTAQGNREILNWATSISSWSANKEYDGNALILHNGNYTDILADTPTTVNFTSTPVTIDSNTIWYSGNSPVVINYRGLKLNESTLTVTAVPISLGAFNINYFTNDHSVDRTFIEGSWSGGTAPYTVTVNGAELSESSSAGPGNGTTGWKATSTGYGVWYDLPSYGTYTVVITDVHNTSVSKVIEYTSGSEAE